jgi:hypothetical protein
MAKEPTEPEQDDVPKADDASMRAFPKYVKNFDGILLAEHIAIAIRRNFLASGGGNAMLNDVQRVMPADEIEDFANRMITDDAETFSNSGVKDTVGVALSGGGIRSAAFCTGAMQALAKNNILPKIDYLSTVSGGGYCGISTVIALNQWGGAYPFFKADEKKDTIDTGTLRDHANYLRMGDLVAMLSNIAVVTKGLVANLLFVTCLMMALAAITLFSKPTLADLCRPGIRFFVGTTPISCDAITGYTVGLISLGLFLALVAVWAIKVTVHKKFEDFKDVFVKIAGFGLPLVLFVFFCDLQPQIIRQMVPASFFKALNESASCDESARRPINAKSPQNAPCAMDHQVALSASEMGNADKNAEPKGWKRFINLLQTIVGPLIALFAFASKQLGDLFKTNEQETGITVFIKKATGQLVVWAVALALPLVMWACYLGLVFWGIGDMADGKTMTYPFAPAWLESVMRFFVSVDKSVYGFAIIYLIFAVLLLDLWLLTSTEPNANSLFGLYRARLNEAFCVPWSVNNVALGNLKLSKLDPRYAPFLLINAALNVQASPKVNRRGRNADFFTFSSLHVGSKATGYVQTKDYEREESQLDLASVMAVSGAAVSSNMGSQSMRPLRFTLALLNARLGAWLLNPRFFTPVTKEKPKRERLIPYFAELFGWLKEDSRSIYLTDGGHIENLGIYELLKRRCKIIIAIDAEADRDLNFSSFVTLQRYARIDLGARIKLQRSSIASRSKDAQIPDGKSQTGPHCAIGKIEYGENESGILVYVKASVTGDENDYIKDYNRRFSDYPHETTGDQFFSEEQFEVYRALGFHAMDEMLSGKDLVQTSSEKLETLLTSTAKGDGVKAFAAWVKKARA